MRPTSTRLKTTFKLLGFLTYSALCFSIAFILAINSVMLIKHVLHGDKLAFILDFRIMQAGAVFGFAILGPLAILDALWRKRKFQKLINRSKDNQ